MRTLKLTLVAAMALALGSTAANAASVDVIWQLSGTATTIVPSSSIFLTANIVLTPTTPLGAAASVIELSADTVGVSYAGSAQTLVGGWFGLGFPLQGPPSHIENVIAQGALFPTPLVAVATIIGTITVHSLVSGSVTVSNSGGADDIFAGAFSVIGEYVFNPGFVVHVPEPATASLLGLGLLGLFVSGRRR